MRREQEAQARAPWAGKWVAMFRPFGNGKGSEEDWVALGAPSKAALALLIWKRYQSSELQWDASPCSPGCVVLRAARRRGWEDMALREELVAFSPGGAWVDPLGLAIYGRDQREAGACFDRPVEIKGKGIRFVHPWNGEGPVPGLRRKWNRAGRGRLDAGFGSKAKDGFACAAAAWELEDMGASGSGRWVAELRMRAAWATQGMSCWWDDWNGRVKSERCWKSQGRSKQWTRD